MQHAAEGVEGKAAEQAFFFSGLSMYMPVHTHLWVGLMLALWAHHRALTACPLEACPPPVCLSSTVVASGNAYYGSNPYRTKASVGLPFITRRTHGSSHRRVHNGRSRWKFTQERSQWRFTMVGHNGR